MEIIFIALAVAWFGAHLIEWSMVSVYAWSDRREENRIRKSRGINNIQHGEKTMFILSAYL